MSFPNRLSYSPMPSYSLNPDFRLKVWTLAHGYKRLSVSAADLLWLWLTSCSRRWKASSYVDFRLYIYIYIYIYDSCVDFRAYMRITRSI